MPESVSVSVTVVKPSPERKFRNTVASPSASDASTRGKLNVPPAVKSAVSMPSPPISVSEPWPPSRMSLPSRPSSSLSALLPVMESAKSVPMTFSMPVSVSVSSVVVTKSNGRDWNVVLSSLAELALPPSARVIEVLIVVKMRSGVPFQSRNSAVSLPSPPMTVSLPRPPRKVSSPSPPSTVSVPLPASNVSLPPRPSRVLLTAFPRTKSL